MTRPQLRLIKGGKIDRPELKIDARDLAGTAIIGTILTLTGTIIRKTIKGRL